VFAASNLKSLAVSSGDRDWASIAANRDVALSGPAGTDQPACTFQNLNNQAQGMAGLQNYLCSPRQMLHPLAFILAKSCFDYKFECLNKFASINYTC
jgi:hypothetical protein